MHHFLKKTDAITDNRHFITLSMIIIFKKLYELFSNYCKATFWFSLGYAPAPQPFSFAAWLFLFSECFKPSASQFSLELIDRNPFGDEQTIN